MFRKLLVLYAVQCVSATIILDCDYLIRTWALLGNIYTCNAKVVQINEMRNVVGVSQNHLAGKTDHDVLGLAIEVQPIDFMPEDINLFFQNLDGMYIRSCPIKSINRKDLEPFTKLKRFSIRNGQLLTINGDILHNLPELQLIEFDSNQITNVGPGIIERNPKLHTFDFRNNLCIDNSAWNATATTIIAKQLAFKCPPSVEMAKTIILEGEKFQEAVNDQLEPEISVLENQMEQMKEEMREPHEKMEVLEKFILNLCATHAICS